jgi:hypothetical protein
LAGLLLLIGLLLTGIFIAIGYRISGPVSRRACGKVSRGLDDVSAAAGQLEKLSRRQAARSEHQVAAAQDMVAELRKLSDLAAALEHGTNLLRESTSQMWAEMSYPAPNAQAAPGMPGGMPTSAAAMRQTTVAASQIGAAAGQARALCHGLRTRLNQIIAEAGLLSSESLEADSCIESLSEAVQRVEEALGSQAGGAAPGSVNDGLWRRLAFWRGGRALAARVAAARMAAGREDADDEPEMGSTMTGSMRAARGDSGVRWTGRAPTVGHISHAPRPYRSGHTGPQLSARSTGVSRAIPHPATPSGPQASGSHPSPSGHGRMPWYSDEQADRSVPPTQQSGGWRGPASGSQSGPRPGNWMNDLR